MMNNDIHVVGNYSTIDLLGWFFHCDLQRYFPTKYFYVIAFYYEKFVKNPTNIMIHMHKNMIQIHWNHLLLEKIFKKLVIIKNQ